VVETGAKIIGSINKAKDVAFRPDGQLNPVVMGQNLAEDANAALDRLWRSAGAVEDMISAKKKRARRAR
jgi:hypothetical protein